MKIQAETSGERLDLFVASACESLSRSHIKNLIESGNILLNQLKAKPSEKIKAGDVVDIVLKEAEETEIAAQNIAIEIVYEDDDLAVINKPQGLTVHPSQTQKDGTLVNAILYHIKTLSGINGELRPGIVHRLDKNTSGLLVIAKNDNAHRSLSKQIEQKTAKRKYIALVFGNVKNDSGHIDAPIGRHKTDRKKMAVVLGGRRAVTDYRVLERFSKYTLVEFSLSTGRTHQIRVHSKYIGHPVVGDDVYAAQKAPFALKGQLLHSYYLSFTHPTTNERLEFSCNPPDYFEKIRKNLR